MIKTFRGLLADDTQDRIRLSTIKGKVGYQIVKFKSMPQAPGTVQQESILKIYKTEQTAGSIDGIIDFTDTDLLGSIFMRSSAHESGYASIFVVFDQQIVNQDIYITHSEVTGSELCNYYLELEVIPLDEAGAEYTTLKDLRTGTSAF